jgi:hypothetical protein
MTMALFCGFTGCMKTTVAIEPTPRKVDIDTADYVAMAHFFISGTIGHAVFDIDKLCPEGADWMRDYRSASDLAIGIASLTIYTPKTVLIKCSEDQKSKPPAGESTDTQNSIIELKNATPIEKNSSAESGNTGPTQPDSSGEIFDIPTESTETSEPNGSKPPEVSTGKDPIENE